MSDTPPVDALLGYWREMTAKGEAVHWGPDRAQAILAHLDALDADVARLREVIAFNREEAARREARHRSEVRAMREALRAKSVPGG